MDDATLNVPASLLFRTILVPHDLTPESDLALARAGELASLSNGVVHLLHVLPYPPGSAIADSTPFVWAERTLLDEKEAVVAKLLAVGDRVVASPVEVHVTLGTPAAQICETAEHIRADLIVMWSEARRGLGSLLQGSIAARTVRRALCPVFTVRRDRAADARSSRPCGPAN